LRVRFNHFVVSGCGEVGQRDRRPFPIAEQGTGRRFPARRADLQPQSHSKGNRHVFPNHRSRRRAVPPFLRLSDAELQGFGVKRSSPTRSLAFPIAIELRDVEQGEAVLLLNYLHQPAETPYKASHAIFVREWAETPYRAVDAIPDVLRIRPISFARLRRFGRHGRPPILIEGELELNNRAPVRQILKAAYVHAHYAKRGCYGGADRSGVRRRE